MQIDPKQVASSPLVLVVGAGINGAAVARELTLNGISVIVVDANDIAFGATSRSSRLIHGGLRYLERGDFDLVRESLRERAILLKTAPQFVQPLRLRIPVRRRFGGLAWSVLTFCGWDRSWLGRFWLRCFPKARERGLWLIRLGLWMYDRLAADSSCDVDEPRPSYLSRMPMACLTATPSACARRGINHENAHADGVGVKQTSDFPFACEYFDAQILSPERFTVALLDDARQLAREHSLMFDVHTHTLAEFHDREVYLVDRLGRDAPITLRPDVVINATGAWGDATLADWRIGSPRLFGGTKGSHFVTANRDLRVALGDAGIYAEASDGRMVFVLPFGEEQSLIGTTDEPFDARPETAVAEPREIDYLIDLVNEVVPSARLTREDVVMSYSGVRPLPFGRSDSPSSIPRGHRIEENTRGPIPILTLIGGKLTTCRALGEEVVDHFLSLLRRPRIASSRDRPLADCRSPTAADSTLLIKDIINHEWVRTLSDLVERRLLLIFDPRLDRSRLRELAMLMADAGVIPPDQIDSEVATTITRLRQVYGIDVEGS
ncbi:MAG: glycerol-3-phosphate dehydrogenase/oxidase [Planctomycetaceae bacterium]